MKPMLEPARDLAGATPETLARALLRRKTPLRPSPRSKPAASAPVDLTEAVEIKVGKVKGRDHWNRAP